MFTLIEDSCLLLYSHIFFWIQSVTIYCFSWSMKKKFSLIKIYIVGKRRSMLIAFPNNCVYYFSLPSLKPGKLSFFKVSCNLEIWNHRNEFLMLCYMKIHWSILYFEHILYTCLLVSWNQASLHMLASFLKSIWKILESLISDADLPKVATLYYTLSIESHLLVLPPIS